MAVARDYGKITNLFWTEWGPKLRKIGPEGLLIAAYLKTGPTANWLGLYNLAVPLMAHHLGMTIEGASKGLRQVAETGYCMWDEGTEMVFIPHMAAEEIAERVVPDDKRHKRIVADLNALRNSPFAKDFCELYAGPFSLPLALVTQINEAPSKPLRRGMVSPFEAIAPSKPITVQEQEQEQKKKGAEKNLLADQETPGDPVAVEQALVADLAALFQSRVTGREPETEQKVRENIADLRGAGLSRDKIVAEIMLDQNTKPRRRTSEYSLQFANRLIAQLGHSANSLATGPAPADAPVAAPGAASDFGIFRREFEGCFLRGKSADFVALWEQGFAALRPPPTLDELRYALHCYSVDPRRTGGDRGKTWPGCFPENAFDFLSRYITTHRRLNAVPGFALGRTEGGDKALPPKTQRLETDLDCIALANALCERIGESRFNLWFAGKSKITRTPQGFRVGVPNKFSQDFLDKTFGVDFRDVLAAVGSAGATVRFAIDEDLFEGARQREERYQRADDGERREKVG
jgi:hypothetical protein